MKMKVFAVMAVTVFVSVVSATAVEQHRRLQQNPFPLDWEGFSGTLLDELSDNYDFGELLGVPTTNSYDGVFNEFVLALGAIIGAGAQRAYDGPVAAASPLG